MVMRMALTSTSRTTLDAESSKDVVSSTFHKAVCLQDWWLVRSETDFQGKRLSVAGLTAERPMRLFSSAPIIKRLDLFTLETADGITVLIKGSVNRSRMHENGFYTEVCNHFLLGFPYYWEDFADQYFKKEFTKGGSSCSSSGPSNKKDNQEHCSSDGHENSVQRGDFKVSQGNSCREVGIHKHEDKVVGTMNPVNSSERKSKDYSFKEMGIHKHEDNVVETMTPINSSEKKSKDYSFKETGIHKHEDNVVETMNPVNSSGRKSKDYSFKERYDPLKDHSLLNDSNVKNITPSEVNINIAKCTRGHLRSSKMLENLSNRIKAICSSRERPNAQDCSNDLVTPFEKKFHGIDSLGLSNIDIEGVARKPHLALPNLRKCSVDISIADMLKNPSVAIGSDANDVCPSMSNMVFPMKTSSNSHECSFGELESSKSYKNNKSITNSGLKAEGLTSLRTYNHDIVKDSSFKNALTVVESASELSNASEVNQAVTVDRNHPTESFRKLKGLNRERKNATIAENCASKENDPMVMGSSEESLLRCNGEYLSDVSFDGVVDGFLSVAPEHPDISERSGHRTSKPVEDPAVMTKAERIVACSAKSSAGNSTTVSISANLENRKEKSFTSESGVENGSVSSIIMPQAVENPASKHQAHGSASNKSERRKSKEIVCSSRLRRSSRLNGLKNSINMLETKSNMVKNVAFDSNVPNSVGVTDSGKSGCGIAVDFSFTQSQRTICESLVKGDNVGSQHGLQSSSKSSSISTSNGAIQKQNSESTMNATESGKQREPCRFSIRPDDSNSNTERGLSQKRTRKKLKDVTDAPTPKRTRSSSKNISSVSPVSLSYKRSRSGRLLVPPVDFWRNEQVVYDMEGKITGVMPVVESCTGSASEILRKKKKFI